MAVVIQDGAEPAERKFVLLYFHFSFSLFQSLSRFGTDTTFFGFSSTLLDLLGSDGIPRSVNGGVLAVVLVTLAWRQKTFWDYARTATGALILLVPILHYWYLTWILLFHVFRPSMPWLIASLSLVVYFEAEHTRTLTGVRAMPPWCPLTAK
ncbi:MAG: hypothetical protein IID38_10125 [Planctomycetes bacterium]|nr:hypothetical protein [Planctomycetota bacterium]